MASKVTDNVKAGDIQLVKELAKQLRYSKTRTRFCIDDCKHGVLAVESLLEKAISIKGKLERSIIDGQDFIDTSDAKKVIVTNNGGDYNTRVACIGGVAKKNGVLRVMVADPVSKQNYYFIIPQKECIGKKNLRITFSKFGGQPKTITNSFSSRAWLLYQVNTFKELCA